MLARKKGFELQNQRKIKDHCELETTNANHGTTAERRVSSLSRFREKMEIVQIRQIEQRTILRETSGDA
jgi:hypothetical protein